VCDQLTEASIPEAFKNTSTSMAADWTDVEAWARPVPHEAAGTGTGPEASWGHRNAGRSVQEGEMFFGYYLSAAVMVADENGEPVPGLARRITVASPGHDPAAELAAVLTTMPASGIALGDIIADSGYAHRVPDTWANPLRAAGADLVQDLHPHDRGPRGTHHGAIIANGNLYCPATPGPLLDLVPLPPGAPAADAAAHDQKTAEVARYKLGVHAAEDADGYRRHACPAAAGKIRCPHRPESMKLPRDRPEILTPPEHPPACCTQHHRRPRRRAEDPAEARLPPTSLADLLPPAHRRRAAQRRDQGPRRQQHRPRLDPADGRHPAHALASPASWSCATSAPCTHSMRGSKTTPAAPLPATSSPAHASAAASSLARPPTRRNQAPGLQFHGSSRYHQHRQRGYAALSRCLQRPPARTGSPRTARQPGTSPRKPGTQDQLSSAARMSEAYVNLDTGEV
jgi:hypothetical protein